MGNYSSGDVASLPTDTADLEHIYDATDLSNVQTDDSNYVEQTATGEYPIHQYKDTITSSLANITWIGKSDQAPSTYPVYLQIYKTAAPAAWETIATKNTGSAGVDFTLQKLAQNTSTDYKDGSNVVCCRVYQEFSTALVRTDNFDRGDNASLGTNWTSAFSSTPFQVKSNQAYSPGTSYEFWSADTFNANQYSQITWKGYDQMGPAVRMGNGGTADAFFIKITSTAVFTKKIVSGVESYTGPESYTLSNSSGDVFKFTASGNQFRVYKQTGGSGDFVALGDAWTDNDLATGQPGMYSINGDGYIDNWEGGNL